MLIRKLLCDWRTYEEDFERGAYMHTYAYICIHMHTYPYISIHIHTYINPCIHATAIRGSMDIHIYPHTWIYTHTWIYIYAPGYTYMHTYIHTVFES